MNNFKLRACNEAYYIVQWLTLEGKVERLELKAYDQDDLLEQLKGHILEESEVLSVFKSNTSACDMIRKHFKRKSQ